MAVFALTVLIVIGVGFMLVGFCGGGTDVWASLVIKLIALIVIVVIGSKLLKLV